MGQTGAPAEPQPLPPSPEEESQETQQCGDRTRRPHRTRTHVLDSLYSHSERESRNHLSTRQLAVYIHPGHAPFQ